jgi:predicted nucleic acid-binding protein
MSSIAKNFMSDKIFLDTNILVYAFGAKKTSVPDPRVAIAERIIMLGGVVSIQVLNEFVQVCHRKAKLSWDQIAGSLDVIKDLCGRAVPLTMETHEAAIDISRHHGFHIYDSLILAAAMQAGCTTVYSEDMQHGQSIGKLTVVNPFIAP